MKLKTLAVQMAALTMVSAPLFADDGALLSKDMSQQEADLYACPSHGEHAFIRMMNFRVPSQASNGELVEIEYIDADGTLRDTLTTAKPLVSVYVYGPVLGVEGAEGFQGHGKREVYASVSLDDGTTWKTTNISESVDLSSFTTTTPIPVPGEYCEEIPLEWNCEIYDTCDTTVASTADSDNMLASLNVAMAAAADSDDDDDDGDDGDDATDGAPVIEEASWEDENATFGELEVEGEAGSRDLVEIRNGVTDDLLFRIRADREGDFEGDRNVPVDQAPCTVVAVVDGVYSDVVEVEDAPEGCVGEVEPEVPVTFEYPGDNNNVYHAVAGNKILIAWQSRFCQAGSPASTRDIDAIATHLEIDNLTDLYLTDLFGVQGSQGSIDYETEGFPQVGEMPFNCLWTARGVLREDPDALGTTEVVWFKNERLTSGRRDLTRIETQCSVGGGCAITWQEDPVGLRPGEGEGPGTGWAGATTNSQTDVWYSYIPWDEFDTVDCNGEALSMQDCAENLESKPLGYVPFAVPMRLTNNARCNVPVTGTEVTYCNYGVSEAYGLKNYCADTTEIPLGPQDTMTPICVADTDRDGTADLPNVANTAASRPRLNLQPRDTDGDGVADDAYVVVASEEDKGLGRFGFPNDVAWTGSLEDTAVPCGDPDADMEDNCIEADIGKNAFYLSFAMGDASSSDSEAEIGLLDNLVDQGAQINRPEVNWVTGTYFPVMDTTDMWDFGDYNYLLFNNMIARRTAMMSQSIAKAATGTSGLLAMPLFKEGILNQGGPADIQAVRVIADVIDQTNDNPYRPENLVCENKFFDDGSNPYYPYGLCMLPTINLSGKTPYTCEASGDSSADCPGVSDNMVCEDTEFGQQCSTEVDPEDQQLFAKLLEWYECPGANDTSTITPACYQEPVSVLLDTNLDDAAWYMPLDVAKAHRGYLDGDFVMMLYATSPNWKLNAVGRDRYDLYLRRSFNGGETFTTTPSSFTASDGVAYSGSGTTTCETMRTGADATSTDERHNCTTYAAGEDEQSRNMSQLKSMRFTVLDPRYTPNMPEMGDVTALLDEYGAIFFNDPALGVIGDLPSSDLRRPDRFHIVFESGDNTTVAVGEAEPLNLDYGRGFNFGDHFQVWYDEVLEGDVIDGSTSCYPSDPHGDLDVDTEFVVGSGFCNEFDTLEGSQTALSEEASMTASAAGDFLYAVWGQVNLDQQTLEDIGGESHFRRVWWIDGYIPSDAYEPGLGQ